MRSKRTKTINNFVQGLPDGSVEEDIAKLLVWVSKSISQMKGAKVSDLMLKGVNIPGEKPTLSVYYETSDNNEESEFKPQVLVVQLEKGKDQSNFILLLKELESQLSSVHPEEILDITLDNEINELGDHYKITVYYD